MCKKAGLETRIIHRVLVLYMIQFKFIITFFLDFVARV